MFDEALNIFYLHSEVSATDWGANAQHPYTQKSEVCFC